MWTHHANDYHFDTHKYNNFLAPSSLPLDVADLHLLSEQELHKVTFGIETAYGGNKSLWR